MTRLAFLAVAVACFLIASLTAPDNGTAPAKAGEGYWSQTDCRWYNGNPDPRLDIWWYSSGGTVYYWIDGYSHNHGGARPVWGVFLARYAQLAYQCGPLGAPVSDRYPWGSDWRQDFQYGYLILEWD